ncbi:MAG TPA: 3',5'-cyclic-nucleotide phosphodiesterase, partial [Thermoanaerobaculia bacterium]|nr:3',5'-cyclic-nucleotide phosphodiesterase [Thermoanaerobaculia bacterium]
MLSRKSLAVRVLGPYGGSAPGYRMTTFLIDGETALDAGSLTEALPIAAQRRIRRVVLTHAHF